MELFHAFLKLIKRYLTEIICIAIAVISVTCSVAYVYFNRCEECVACDILSEEEIKTLEVSTEEPVKTVKIDVKGAVKKPGVYEIAENSTVSDALQLAGGLAANGVTDNINLSKRLANEMVIYIFTKNELKEIKSANRVVCEIPKCECERLDVNNDICASEEVQSRDTSVSTGEVTEKISINSDSIEELTKLDGIGEAKAKAIIEYRRVHGNFKNAEDIKEVEGIGEKAYEKIKDKIKI